MIKLKAIGPSPLFENTDVEIIITPNHCPFCHNKINPNILQTYWRINDTEKGEGLLDIVCRCTYHPCNAIFIASYIHNPYDDHFDYIGTSPGKIKQIEFSKFINDTSPDFSPIYNEAYHSELIGLSLICGMGYRKALEFLIKDYLVLQKPEFEESIKNNLLGKCIKEYIDHPKIKFISERAAWLGNDHSHYLEKWPEKDLSELKALIEIVVRWIEMDLMTKHYEENMKVGR